MILHDTVSTTQQTTTTLLISIYNIYYAYRMRRLPHATNSPRRRGCVQSLTNKYDESIKTASCNKHGMENEKVNCIVSENAMRKSQESPKTVPRGSQESPKRVPRESQDSPKTVPIVSQNTLYEQNCVLTHSCNCLI